MPEEETISLKKYSEVLKLPHDLLRTVLSKETPEKITEVCLRSRVDNAEQLEKIGYQTGLVLLGKLPPEGFRKALETKVGLAPEIAERINQSIEEIIFDPLKESLNQVYKKEAPPPKPEAKPEIPEEKPPVPKKADVYREPLE